MKHYQNEQPQKVPMGLEGVWAWVSGQFLLFGLNVGRGLMKVETWTFHLWDEEICEAESWDAST